MMLSGMVYVQYTPSTSPVVIGLLVAGFASLIFFALWETFALLKQPLASTRLFTHNKGRTLTAPFIVGFVVTMFYYGTNILWPTMFGFYFINAETPFHIILLLATVQGFGIFTGAMILFFGGTHFGHWKWQMTIPITFMTFFGGLLAYVKTRPRRHRHRLRLRLPIGHRLRLRTIPLYCIHPIRCRSSRARYRRWPRRCRPLRWWSRRRHDVRRDPAQHAGVGVRKRCPRSGRSGGCIIQCSCGSGGGDPTWCGGVGEGPWVDDGDCDGGGGSVCGVVAESCAVSLFPTSVVYFRY
jgi:hypothetical protein